MSIPYSFGEVASRQYEERGLAKDTLCGQCQHSQITRRKSRLEIRVHCRVVNEYVPGDIAECNKFEHYKAMDLYEMKEIAIMVDKRLDVNDGSYR